MLLDTCALLWLAGGGRKLSRTALEEIERASSVYVSAISAFEIAVKYRKGKLDLPVKPQEWFEIAVEHHELSVFALDVDICVASTELPPFHNDSCDRFIIATAKRHSLPIVTTDRKFKAYGLHLIS